jgi:UPF0042 nucleotide-binding protein
MSGSSEEGADVRASVVVVTGLSGAGKSTALSALGDAGYYCVDNLPPTLTAATVRVCRDSGIERVALGMDVRVGAFLDMAGDALAALQHHPGGLSVVFLDAADDVLVRRFSETRRPHPLLTDDADGLDGVLDAVKHERERLAPIRANATWELDTGQMSVHELRRQVLARFGDTPDGRSAPLRTRVMSFGFKHGVPLDADLMFDVRFLDNPHFEPELRKLTGQQTEVRDFVLASNGATELLEHLERLLLFALPRYEREGKSYLTVAVGCTGGRHRSVALAAELARRLAHSRAQEIAIVHRDVARDSMMAMVSVVPDARSFTEGEAT